MKIHYKIALEDVKSFQPLPKLKAGRNAGFIVLVVFAICLAGLGMWCVTNDKGPQVCGFIFGLAAMTVVGGYILDRSSVNKSREAYQKSVQRTFQQIHCVNSRSFEFDANSFNFSCACGTVTRPWTELTRLSENEHYFFLGTNSDLQWIPKKAFSSDGEVTDFRALAQSKIARSNLLPPSNIEFNYGPRDFWNGFLLHAARGAGWKRILSHFTVLAVAVFTFVMMEGPELWIKRLMVAVFVGAYCLKLDRLIPKNYPRWLRINFDEQDLYLQDESSTVRMPWAKHVGFLEDDEVILLYLNPKLYRVIPKRSIPESSQEFRRILLSALPAYSPQAN